MLTLAQCHCPPSAKMVGKERLTLCSPDWRGRKRELDLAFLSPFLFPSSCPVAPLDLHLLSCGKAQLPKPQLVPTFTLLRETAPDAGAAASPWA